MGCGVSGADIGEKESKQDEVDKAILDLKRQRDRLKKYTAQQEQIASREIETARELLRKGLREKAKFVMRQKKQREVTIEKTEKMIENVQHQIDNIENAQMQVEMVKNVEQTNALLKQLTDMMPIEEVERIMDENAEQQDKLNEIESVLYQNMDPDSMRMADEEYEKMLQQLDGDEEQEEAPPKPAPKQESSESEQESSSEEKVVIPGRVAVAA